MGAQIGGRCRSNAAGQIRPLDLHAPMTTSVSSRSPLISFGLAAAAMSHCPILLPLGGSLSTPFIQCHRPRPNRTPVTIKMNGGSASDCVDAGKANAASGDTGACSAGRITCESYRASPRENHANRRVMPRPSANMPTPANDINAAASNAKSAQIPNQYAINNFTKPLSPNRPVGTNCRWRAGDPVRPLPAR